MNAYRNERWLRLQYITKKKTEEEIAEICQVNQSTIHRWLVKFKIRES